MNRLLTTVRLAIFRSVATALGRLAMRLIFAPAPVLARARVTPRQARRNPAGRTLEGEYRRVSEPNPW